MPKIQGVTELESILRSDKYDPSRLAQLLEAHQKRKLVIDDTVLATMFRGELTAETKHRPNFQKVADKITEWVCADFFDKLKFSGETLMVCGARKLYSYDNYREVRTDAIRAQLPKVAEKIRKGDLQRFVNLISSSHSYIMCCGCGSALAFTGMQLASALPRPAQRFWNTPETLEERQKMSHRYTESAAWAGVLGYCGRKAQCVPSCQMCGFEMGPVFNGKQIKTHNVDQMCIPCADKQLVNTKHPKFSRQDQRRLQRLIIS